LSTVAIINIIRTLLRSSAPHIILLKNKKDHEYMNQPPKIKPKL